MSRRRFMIGAATLAVTGAALPELLLAAEAGAVTEVPVGPKLPPAKRGQFSTNEPVTGRERVTHYNNFYEFSTTKEEVAELAHTLRPRPWTVVVDGHVKRRQVYDVEALIKRFPLEERIYRLRCVEGWSAVIPWVGFPLRDFIKRVEPTSRAKFVQFTTLYDPEQMPGQHRDVLPWPYVEGLRLDEAVHPLALLAVGMYGEVLPNQDGAPFRLVVPWKYGFKSIKSIVRLSFVEKMPLTTWANVAPDEYGFYANVNPQVDHPRWSQARERRLGEFFKRDTLMFNGYVDQVARLYTGMDLKQFF